MRCLALWLMLCALPQIVRPQPAEPHSKRSEQAQLRGYLGVAVVSVNEEEVHGALVRLVQDESPAFKAGMRPNDVILEFNGKPVDSAADLGQLVQKARPGHKVKIKIYRGGAMVPLTVSLAAWAPRPEPTGQEPNTPFGANGFPGFSPMDFPAPALRWESPQLGIEYEAVSAQLADYFGVDQGLLIRAVKPKSAADNAGMKAGDVVVKLDSKSITHVMQFSSALRETGKKDKKVGIDVMRNHKPYHLEINLTDQSPQTMPWMLPTQ
jgi:serine protease Do